MAFKRGIAAKLQQRKAKKTQSRAVYGSDPVGSVGLWYGKGKIAFTGKLTFGDYRDDDAVHYSLLIFETEERKKYIFSGIVTLYKEPKSKERQPRVGSVYVYESSQQAAYMMIYMDTDVEGETETFVCPLSEGNSSNPKACALFGKVFDSKDTDNEIKQKTRTKKARKAIVDAKKTASDDWYTDLEPKDLITIIKSYDEDKFYKFIEFLNDYYKELENSKSEKDEQEIKLQTKQDIDVGYEVVEDEEDEYEEEEIEDIEEEEEELPVEQSKTKLRIRDIASKNSDTSKSKSLLKRVSSEFFQGLDSADVEDIV